MAAVLQLARPASHLAAARRKGLGHAAVDRIALATARRKGLGHAAVN